MLPQRIHQERVESYFTAYFAKPFAVLFFIALDRSSIHRLNSWYAYLKQQDCISSVSGDIVRNNAHCGKLDLKFEQRLQWPMKVGIVVGIVIGSVVLFVAIIVVLWRILLLLLPGPGIREERL